MTIVLTARATFSALIDAEADATWTRVRDFGGIAEWHPAITSSVVADGASGAEIGAVRRLTLGDGSIVHERLVALDDAERHLGYTMLDPAPIPVLGSLTRIAVLPVTATRQSVVSWNATFDVRSAADGQTAVSVSVDEVWPTGVQGLQASLARTRRR